MVASNYFRHALCTNMYLLSPSPYTEKDYKFSIFTVCMFYDLCTYKLYIWRIVYRNWSQKAAIFWFKFTRYLVRNTQVFISSLPGKTFSFDFVIDEGAILQLFPYFIKLAFPLPKASKRGQSTTFKIDAHQIQFRMAETKHLDNSIEETFFPFKSNTLTISSE